MSCDGGTLLDALPPESADAVDVICRLRQAGHAALLAGGCVRDLLLNRPPKDFDVATDAPPGRVRELFANTQAVGAAFGVILVRHRRSQIEVATFRTDGTYTDGRRPDSVVFSTPEHDARRRDFTINGLFLDPISSEVIDYVGGRADLSAKLIRAIGNPSDRLAEDHLRLLRAVRFASRLGFAIEPVTAAAIQEHAMELARISPERIADELRRMLTSAGYDQAFKLLVELELLAPAFRFQPSTVDVSHSLFLRQTQPPRSFGLATAILALDDRWQRAGRPSDPRAWLGREANSLSRHVRDSLKLSNDESTEMEQTLTLAGRMLLDPPAALAAKKRFLAQAAADSARMLLDVLAAADLFAERISELQVELTELAQTDYAPLPLVTGDDLTAAGATPGPKFKRALDSVYDEQLEGRITTREAALALAMRRVE